MEQGRFCWTILGAGAMAKRIIKFCKHSPLHKVERVFTRDSHKAENIKKKYGIDAVTCEDEAIAKATDGIYIASPNTCHYRQAMKCIDAGKPVLIEKTITMNADEMQSLIDNPNRRAYVGEAMWMRYNPVVSEIRNLISSGEVGKPKQMDAEYTYPRQLSGFSSRVTDKELGGGALLDTGVYLVSYAHMIFGNPIKVTSNTTLNKYGTDDITTITLHYPNNVKCNLTCGINKLSLCRMRLTTDNALIKSNICYKPTKAVCITNGTKRVVRGKNGYDIEFDMVRSDILEGKQESSVISLQESLEVVKILDRIRRTNNLYYDNDKIAK